MNSIGLKIGAPLDRWIDPKTGKYDKNTADEFLKALAVCAVDIVNEFSEGGAVFQNKYFSPEALDLKLSNELPCRKSAGMPLADIKKLLDEIIAETPDDRLLQLKEMLAGTKDVRALRRNLEIRRILNEIPLESEKLCKLFFEIDKKQSLILAKSFPSAAPDKLWDFTLYPRAIAVSRRTAASSFGATFWATLAHDTFHAYHYSAFVERGIASQWNSKTFPSESRIVKESIGVTFEDGFVTGCKERGIFTAKEADVYRREMLTEWLSNDVNDWVYSGALGIVENTMPDSRFAQINCLVEYSLKDWLLPATAIKAGYYAAKVRHSLSI